METVFSADEAAIARELFLEVSPSVDRLPYTAEFDWMHAEFCARTNTQPTKDVFFHRLTNLRKKGDLRRSNPK